MKSLAELAAIREKMKDKVILREGTGEIRVVVGMATCGIAAGAKTRSQHLRREGQRGRSRREGHRFSDGLHRRLPV